MIKLISVIYILLLVFTIIFQMGVLFGKQWGEYTMGGYHKGKLPWPLRFNAIISISILIFIAIVIMQKVELISTYFYIGDSLIWFIVVFNSLAFFMNTITQSKKEKKLWQPITGIMLLISVIVALFA